MKIKPAIRGPKNYVKYQELCVTDTFNYQNQLWVKTGDADDDCGNTVTQLALNMATGQLLDDMCNEQVLPVDAVLTWTKQKE